VELFWRGIGACMPLWYQRGGWRQRSAVFGSCRRIKGVGQRLVQDQRRDSAAMEGPHGTDAYANDNGYATRPGDKAGHARPSAIFQAFSLIRALTFNEAPWLHFCRDCGASDMNNSRTWERCKACAAKKRERTRAKFDAKRRKR
jgi:hypothetical protein